MPSFEELRRDWIKRWRATKALTLKRGSQAYNAQPRRNFVAEYRNGKRICGARTRRRARLMHAMRSGDERLILAALRLSDRSASFVMNREEPGLLE
jgi:hypothetical protein